MLSGMSQDMTDDQNEKAPEPPLQIPWEQVSDDALQGIIDEFIMREGTDYGANEVEHATKVQQVKKQLAKGQIHIVFEPESKSVTIVTEREWAKMRPDA